MTEYPDDQGSGADQDEGRIVISGLDDAGQPGAEAQGGNTSPTDEAVERLQRQRDRGEPEDEDG